MVRNGLHAWHREALSQEHRARAVAQVTRVVLTAVRIYLFACNVSSLITSGSSFRTQTTGVGGFITPVTIHDLTKELRRFDIYKGIYQLDTERYMHRYT